MLFIFRKNRKDLPPRIVADASFSALIDLKEGIKESVPSSILKSL